jgi:hypothetical protein
VLQSVIKPKRPNNPCWRSAPAITGTPYPAEGWKHDRLGLFVISAVEVSDAAIGPEYHISITRSRPQKGKSRASRCSAQEAQLVLKQFDAEAALEDNHGPLVRSFWLPVAEQFVGMECDCKAEETAIADGDFEWRPLTRENADRAGK